MKWLKILALGIAIWSMGLVWPEVNQILTGEMMVGIGLVAGALILSRKWLKRCLSEAPVEPELPGGAYRPRTPGDSRPIKPLGLV